MAFAVGNTVIAQKLGGQTGNKAESPAFLGTVEEVLPGSQYRIHPIYTIPLGRFDAFFPNFIADEADLIAGY